MARFVGRDRELGILEQELARVSAVEIDIVGADRAPVAQQLLLFVGSIKWLERSPFDDHDLAELYRHRAALTDQLLPTVVVSRSGVSCGGPQVVFSPQELLEAWAGRAN